MGLDVTWDEDFCSGVPIPVIILLWLFFGH